MRSSKVIRRAEQRLHVTGPAYRDNRDDQRIFEQQIPADQPRHQLAERGVTIGIGAAGDRDQARELGIAQAGKCAAHSCDNEGEHHGRTRTIGDCRGRSHEQTRADNCSNAQHDQVNRPEGPFEAMFADVLRLGHQPHHRAMLAVSAQRADDRRNLDPHPRGWK